MYIRQNYIDFTTVSLTSKGNDKAGNFFKITATGFGSSIMSRRRIAKLQSIISFTSVLVILPVFLFVPFPCTIVCSDPYTSRLSLPRELEARALPLSALSFLDWMLLHQLDLLRVHYRVDSIHRTARTYSGQTYSSSGS